MADICQPFDVAPPATALFNPKNVAIVSNGRCVLMLSFSHLPSLLFILMITLNGSTCTFYPTGIGRRCASSCSLFSVTMAKEEGAKTVVYGGKKGVQQEYCGTVGGQSTDFSTIDTEIKVRFFPFRGLIQKAWFGTGHSCVLRLSVCVTEQSTHLKSNPAAPPDLYVVLSLAHGLLEREADINACTTDSLTNSVQGITWRLGFGVDDPTQPEGASTSPHYLLRVSVTQADTDAILAVTEWQDHPADVNLPLTPET